MESQKQYQPATALLGQCQSPEDAHGWLMANAGMAAQMTPTRRIMLAVLAQALHDLRAYAPGSLAKDKDGDLIYADARRWLMGNADEHIYSAASICDHLGLSLQWLREVVARGRLRQQSRPTVLAQVDERRAPRSAQVLEAMLAEPERVWTGADVMRRCLLQRDPAGSALQWLTKLGHVERVGRGEYRVRVAAKAEVG